MALAGGLTYAFLSLSSVGEGQVGIKLTGGQMDDAVNSGWTHVIPIYQGFKIYDADNTTTIELVGQQVYYSPDSSTNEEKTQADSLSDNSQQYTNHDFTIRFQLDPRAVPALHRRFGSMDAINKLVRDAGIEAYKAVVRKIDPLKINTQREAIGPDVAKLMEAAVSKELGSLVVIDGYGKTVIDEKTGGPLVIQTPIKLSSVRFLDFKFPDGVENAFETANAARAGVQRAEFERRAAEISVETQRLAGEAEGAKALAKATAEATAISVQGKALAANPRVIELRAIEAWKDGGSQVPKTYVSGGPNGSGIVPFLPIGTSPTNE